MSEAVRDIRLRVVLDDHASAPLKKLHAQAQAGVKDVAREQEKADAAYIRATKLKLKAENDLAREIERRIKDREKEQAKEERDYIRATKAKLRAEKQLADEQIRSAREAAREQERLNRQVNATLREQARESAREASAAARAKAKADRGSFRDWKAMMDMRHHAAMSAWKAEQDATHKNKNEVASLIKTGVGLLGVSRVAGAIGDEFRRSSEYVEKTALKFADLRTALQQVASLRGEKNTNKFTLQQINAAAKAGLTPEEWTRAQEAFLNPAGSQLEGPNAKMTQAQAEEYELRVARFGKARGIGPELGMALAGSILEQSPKALGVKEAMEQFNPAVEVLQKGRIELGRAVPMIPEIMSHGGISAAEAATMLNVVAPAAPGQEVTSAEAAIRALEEMRVGGKGEAFGVTDKMSKYEAFKAFGQNIAGREKALAAKGLNDEQIEVEIAKQLKEAGIADDIRERRGLVRGMARQGIELKGFETYEATRKATTATTDIEAVKAFEASDEGRASLRRAKFAQAEAKAGFRGDSLAALRMEAETALINQKKFEQVPGVDKALGLMSFVGADSTRDQQINRQAIYMARRQLGQEFTTTDLAVSANRGLTDELLRELIQKTEQQTKAVDRQTALLEQQAKNKPAAMGRPVPPMPAGR